MIWYKVFRSSQVVSASKATLSTAKQRVGPSTLFQYNKKSIELTRGTATMASSIKLNNGHQMPLVGFGLWKVNNDTCADQVYNAIKTGYRLFDGAVSIPLALSDAS